MDTSPVNYDPTITPIKNIEQALNLRTPLRELGYHSIFDIVKHSKSAFIKKNHQHLGKNTERVYDLAVGQAHQLRRGFRQNQLTSSIRAGIPTTLNGQKVPPREKSPSNLQGLMKNGPTWQNQFSENWAAYCQNQAPEAYDSPVAYLAWLYNQAVSFENSEDAVSAPIIPLSVRRPDLTTQLIDEDAINQVMPSLQLVNEILSSSINPYINQQLPLISVDETLSTTRYPTLLPYHFPHDQVELSLESSGILLEDIIGQADVAWPYFLFPWNEDGLANQDYQSFSLYSEQALELASQLAPEQLKIVTEPDNSSDPSKLPAFYQLNLGYATSGYTPFEELEVFTHQLGITALQVEKLIAGTTGGSSVILSPNIKDSSYSASSEQYGAVFINGDVAGAPPLGLASDAVSKLTQLTGLSDARMNRINRMVRLQRWLDLPYEQVDLLLTSCINAQNSHETLNPGFSLNTNTLRMLGVFRHYQQKYNVTAFQFAAVLHQITPYAIAPAVPFLDQIFNSPALFEEPFAITGVAFDYTALTGPDARIVKQLCAGLGLTLAQFQVLANKIATDLVPSTVSTHTLPCTLDVVSAFYRLTMLPRWLGLSFAEGTALITLLNGSSAWPILTQVPYVITLDSSGQPTGADILDALMALDSAAEWAKTHSRTWVTNYLMLQEAPTSLVPTDETFNFIDSINQQLPATLLNEQVFETLGVPTSYPGLLNFHHCSVVGGVTGPGYQLDSSKAQYASFTEEANTLTNGSSNYTIGGWVRISTGTSISVPVLANSASNKQGIFISAQANYFLGVTLSNDINVSLENHDTVKFSSDAWFYLAITLDATNEHLTVYSVAEDATVSSTVIDYAPLPPPIVTTPPNVWRLNENGPLSFYSTYPDHKAIIAYDDISVWDSVLTQEQISAIAASKQPATRTVPTKNSLYQVSIDWMTTLDDIIDASGLVLPVVTDFDTLSEMVTADISALSFDDSVNAAQVINTLTTTIYQAKLAQDAIADSSMAQQCKTPQSLSTFLFQWASDSEYRLLSDSLLLNGITTTDGVPSTYLQRLYELERRASLVNQFQLTPATLNSYLSHPTWFGVPDTSISLSLLYCFSRYEDWLKLATQEDAVLAYLTWVHQDASPTPDASTAAKALAKLLNWESSEVELAARHFSTSGIATTLADVDGVMRLQTLSLQTGLSVSPLLNVGALTVDTEFATWQAVGESLVAAPNQQ